MSGDLGNVVWVLVVGLVVGWLAGQIVRGGGFGVLGDIIVGVLGAGVGRWLSSALGLFPTSTIGLLLMSVLGAVVLVGVVRLIKRA